jgi:hypothetical protein
MRRYLAGVSLVGFVFLAVSFFTLEVTRVHAYCL